MRGLDCHTFKRYRDIGAPVIPDCVVKVLDMAFVNPLVLVQVLFGQVTIWIACSVDNGVDPISALDREV